MGSSDVRKNEADATKEPSGPLRGAFNRNGGAWTLKVGNTDQTYETENRINIKQSPFQNISLTKYLPEGGCLVFLS